MRRKKEKISATSSSSTTTTTSPSASSSKSFDVNAFRIAGLAIAPQTLAGLTNTPLVLHDFLNVDIVEQWPDLTTIESVTHWGNLFGSEALSLITVMSCYVLADAAENNRLKSDTYQRLAIGNILVISSVVAALLLAQNGSQPPPRPNASAVATFGALSLPCLFASVNAIGKYGNGFDGFFDRFKKDWNSLLNFTNKDASYISRYYKFSLLTTLIVGSAFALSPTSPLSATNEPYANAEFVRRLFGLVTVFGLAPVQFVLLDASSRNRLGGGTFKKLNLSIAASIFLLDWMTIWGYEKLNGIVTPEQITAINESSETFGISQIYNYVGAICVSFATFGVYLYQGIFAKK